MRLPVLGLCLIVSACVSGPPAALRKANQAAAAGDYDRAIALYQPLAQEGNKFAQAQLFSIYDGPRNDEATALYWLREMAKTTKDPQWQYNFSLKLGNYLRTCADKCRAAEYLTFEEAMAWVLVAEQNGYGGEAKVQEQKERITRVAGIPATVEGVPRTAEYLRLYKK